ncbi:MAG: hypothetical protein JNG84_09690 [Archangium sp.]|nr:hypothetical protein [Archangium sp.]
MRWLLLLLGLVCGCRCSTGVQPASPGQLLISPSPAVFPPTYVGSSSTIELSFSNAGQTDIDVELTIDAPFSVEPHRRTVARGATETVQLVFSPTSEGQFTAELHAGAERVAVSAEAIPPPTCVASDVCHSARLDEALRQCVESTLDNGTSCASRCVTGSCTSGTCVGTSLDCDDGDVCTDDACSEADGCVHPLHACAPATTPCRNTRCDSALGCVEEIADDGVLCGPDLCTSAEVDVCIAGQCVRRTRPDSGRCDNRWVPITPTAIGQFAAAYDAARGDVVLFGGYALRTWTAEMWRWSGGRWARLTPAASPSSRGGHAMAYDSARQRVVLFGGSNGIGALSDTWEWDGVTWLQRSPPTSPPARSQFLMAYDVARRRTVLVGGFANGGSTEREHWEWDGFTWTQGPNIPLSSPGERYLTYDPVRRALVLLVNGVTSSPTETFEFDGVAWVRRVTGSPFRAIAMAFSTRLGQVMCVDQTSRTLLGWNGGAWNVVGTAPETLLSNLLLDDSTRRQSVYLGTESGSLRVVEWDGTDWSPPSGVAPPLASLQAVTFDVDRRVVVLLVQRATWEFDGQRWRFVTDGPPDIFPGELAYDRARQRTVLMGLASVSVTGPPPRTWEYDGVEWRNVPTVNVPSPRLDFGFTYDVARGVTVLYGGNTTTSPNQPMSDTWTYDGAEWTQQLPLTTPPPGFGARLVYDEARQQPVLFTGAANGTDTWSWTGSDWAPISRVSTTASSNRPALAYDSGRQRAVMIGFCGVSALCTFELSGSTLTRLHPVETLPPTGGYALVYDGVNQRVMATLGASWHFVP